MSKLTLRDIAQKAGVSKSTVSRALNNVGYVSPQARERIMQLAQGYTVRSGADKQEQTTIGVMVPSLRSEFFSYIVDGISSAADENSCGIILCSTDDDPQKELRSLKMLREMKIRGLIITPAAAYQAMAGWNTLQAELDDLNIPVVLVDRNVKKSNWDCISYDNFNGAYMIGEALAAEGYHRIGAIVGDTCLQLGIDRLNGFKLALETKQIEPDENDIYACEKIITKDMSYEYTMGLIREKRLPEAIFLSNALIANGFFKAIFASGVVPGKDICCMGFDYIDALDILEFDYSYLDREMQSTGRMAVQMLLDRFEKNIASRREFIMPTKLVHRVGNSRGGAPK